MKKLAELYIVKLTNKEYNIKNLFNYVSSERKKKIESFKFYNDSYRSLIAALISRYAIMKRTNLRNSSLVFDKNRYGKPYLCNNTKEEIHFNISHSGNYVICIIDNYNCGADVEKHDKRHIILAKDTFHINEQNEINKYNNEEDKVKKFFQIWTIKEAYLKFLGIGLSKSMTSFYVDFNENEINIIDLENISKEFNIYSFETNDKYNISYISRNKVSLNYISDKEIIKYFSENM